MTRPSGAFLPPVQGGQPPPRPDVSAVGTRQPEQPAMAQVGRLLNVMYGHPHVIQFHLYTHKIFRPVGLREAALDSPTSRASTIHFADQVDLIEKWLDDYLKSTNRLMAESLTLENVLNNFISHATLPTSISEAVLDQDYSILAMRKYSEGAKDYWMSMLAVVKRLNSLVVEPIRAFLQNDLRAFKEVRRNLEHCQKSFDSLQNKYAAQGKSKEPSSLREDAFQLHEARKAYLKASMEFFILAPQLKLSLDKLLVRLFFDQWREMRISRDNSSASFARNAQDMERVRGWTQEIENSEKAFRKELHIVRKELEDAAELSTRPSRELEDYAISTAPYSGRPGPATSGANLAKFLKGSSSQKAEKQGWLYLRTYTGKPTRTNWLRRWAFVRSGIFGWLIQGTRAGGVEESEHIGVLLCNVRPAPAEERRFCFEVKTKKHAIMLQAETQAELNEWISVFEAAKSRAVEDPQASAPLASTRQESTDSAFAISAPPVPEFGTTILGSLEPGAADEGTAVERSNTLPVPGQDLSKDGVDAARRSTTFDRDEPPRESTSRLGRKLDLHRKSANNSPLPSSPSTPTVGGGIASLIAATHGSMPVGPSVPITPVDTQSTKPKVGFTLALRDMPPSTLAPSTLANPPVATSLSKTAVVVAGERRLGAGSGRANAISTGMMANMWGSLDWAFVNRPEHNESQTSRAAKPSEQAPPTGLLIGFPSKDSLLVTKDVAATTTTLSTADNSVSQDFGRSRTPSPGSQHKNTISGEGDAARRVRADVDIADFPIYYPLQLKTQDAQFRLLFPGAKREERLVFVFRATWNPSDQQEFPGRGYVTSDKIYFYSHHLGLVLATAVAFKNIDEVTAAPGRECDFVFLHLKESRPDNSSTRITIKTFLEPFGLLQRRLSFLVRNSVADEPQNLENIIKILVRMEQEGPERSPSMESWDESSPIVPAPDSPIYQRGRSMPTLTDYKAPTRIDRTLGQGFDSTFTLNKDLSKFKLPAQPVNYTPPGNLPLAVEKLFDVSPKALFHLLFGDKSAVWQLLQHERRAERLKQGPWINMGEARLRRDFDFIIPTTDILGRAQLAEVRDYQVVDVNNDHLCYVVTDKRTAWHLPFRRNYRLVSKVVITHVAKGKCKLAIFIKVEWLKKPWVVGGLIERYAMNDLNLDALDIVDLVADQVRRLGPHSRTKKAIQIFGQLGQSTEITQLQLDHSALNLELRRNPTSRTLFDLVRQDLGSVLESMLAMMLQGIMGLLKWTYNTCTAHSLILVLLGVSILFNTFYSYRDTYSWWHERNASKFMVRIGVTPNTVMSKAVHVQDLEELLSQNGDLPSLETTTCYSVFHDEHQLDDLDAPLRPSSSHTAMTTRASAHRLQRTRQRLGTYRHDLLVAMRVVNSIEREVLQTEWERWLTTENRRCRQIEAVLKESGNNGTKMLIPDALAARGNDVREWYDDYCVSCRHEHDKLVGQ